MIADVLIQNLRIGALGNRNIGVSEQFAHHLDRHIVIEQDSRGKGFPGRVMRQFLVDTHHIRNFPQIGIDLLIGNPRLDIIVRTIEFTEPGYQFLSLREQWNGNLPVRLLTDKRYPIPAVKSFRDMLRLQRLRFMVGKPRIDREEVDVLHRFQPFLGKMVMLQLSSSCVRNTSRLRSFKGLYSTKGSCWI